MCWHLKISHNAEMITGPDPVDSPIENPLAVCNSQRGSVGAASDHDV